MTPGLDVIRNRLQGVWARFLETETGQPIFP
jgi:hypothetical protein